MRLRATDIAMKIIAMAAIFSLAYPAIMIFRVWLFADDAFFKGTLLSCFSIAMGYSAHCLVDRCKGSTVLKILAVFLPVFLSIAAAFVMNMDREIAGTAYELLITLLLVFLGFVGYSLDTCLTLFDRCIKPGVVVLVLAAGSVAYFDVLSRLRPYSLAAVYLFIILYMVIRNHDSLYFNIFARRSSDAKGAPEKIKKYNILWVLVLFGALFILMNFKFIVELSLNVVQKYSIDVVNSLLQYKPEVPEASQEEADKALSFGFPGGGILLPEPISKSILVVYILLYFGMFYVIYILLRLLFRAIAVFISSSMKAGLTGSNKDNDYIDHVETVREKSEAEIRREVKRRLRNVKSDLRNITNPVDRVRYLYGAILEILSIKDTGILRTDTTGEIYEKSVKLHGIADGLKDTTILYDAVRYGSKIPCDSEVKDIEGTYYNITDKPTQ